MDEDIESADEVEETSVEETSVEETSVEETFTLGDAGDDPAVVEVDAADVEPESMPADVEQPSESEPIFEVGDAALVAASDLDGYDGPTYDLVDQDGNVLNTFRADVPFGFELEPGQSVVRND